MATRRSIHSDNPAIPEQMNLALVALYILLHVVFYIGLPLYLLPMSPLWGLLLVAYVLLTPFFWALAHESLHSILFADHRRNKVSGRILCVLFGAPFQILRFGHLIHHRFARSRFDCMEVYDPARQSFAGASGEYYFRLLGGLYLTELVGNLAAFLPRRPLVAFIGFLFRQRDGEGPDLAPLAVRAYTDPDKLKVIRVDSAAALLVLALAFAAFGSAWWMLALALTGRGILQSMIDNAPHYDTPMDQPDYALNLALPKWAERSMLNFNCHRVHHIDATLSWIDLPAHAAKTNEIFEKPWLPAVLRQLRGPVRRDLLPAQPVGS